MPIKVKLKGIFEFMNEDQAKNFFQAVLAKSGLVLDLEERLSPFMLAMHFGSYTNEGLPVSSYSTSPQKNYRTLMTPLFPKSTAATTEKLKLVDNHDLSRTDWYEYTKCPSGQFVCGVTVWNDRDDSSHHKVLLVSQVNDEAGKLYICTINEPLLSSLHLPVC